ncbi:DUF983 domain-containing protein [Robertkochia solimangrovi]|uniref:DUF983 domain-containing protein n=1 Tax=Robertkochia solimangrovi TaxID=2213046 RepID=UPI001180DF37|nr:DUF983 domain-containing protein [Robertkochia solimangrovi]TRZ43219.1 DUF983 domain-containing protein [Robertkochia solimangrovi]
MLKKGSKLYSILTGTCPKCQMESMYMYKNPYMPTHTLKMNERCSHCHTKYKIEPSFFYGAMYVSYAVGTAFAVAAFVISYLFIGTSLKTSFFAIVGTLVVFMPVIMRLSRNIWINFFMKYDPEANQEMA